MNALLEKNLLGDGCLDKQESSNLVPFMAQFLKEIPAYNPIIAGNKTLTNTGSSTTPGDTDGD